MLRSYLLRSVSGGGGGGGGQEKETGVKKIGGSAKKILSLPYFYSLPPFSNKRHRNSLPVFIAGKKTKKTFFSRNLPAKRQSLDISPPPPFFAVVVFRSRGKEGVDKIGIGGDFWTSRFSKTNVEI